MWKGTVNRQPGYRARNLQRRGGEADVLGTTERVKGEKRAKKAKEGEKRAKAAKGT